MYKFIYAKHKIHPKCEETYIGWYLLIDNIDSLMDFIDYRKRKLVKVYFDLKNRKSEKGGHYFSADQTLIGITMEHTERKTITDDANVLDSLTDGYVRFYNAKEKFVVNPNCFSYRDIDDTFEILETYSSKELVFPNKYTEKDIVVQQWMNGKHWYVRVGNYDLKDKFITYEKGYEAGKELIK